MSWLGTLTAKAAWALVAVVISTGVTWTLVRAHEQAPLPHANIVLYREYAAQMRRIESRLERIETKLDRLLARQQP